jgi:hypothetical protein
MARTTLPRKPQRKCIFCGEGGTAGNQMSEEHIWSKWMHEYLPELPSRLNVIGMHRIRQGEYTANEKVRERDVFNRRFRLVCQRCNSGWMGAIEEEAKPLLATIIQGKRSTLLRKHRNSIAVWIALKVMITECIDPADSVITQSERNEFRLTRKIPKSLRIWIGTHDTPEWHAGYSHETVRARVDLTGAPKAEPLGEFKNVQVTSIGLGRAFFLSIALTLRGYEANARGPGLRQLWPLRQGPIVWPLANLSAQELRNLASSVLGFISTFPRARWARE